MRILLESIPECMHTFHGEGRGMLLCNDPALELILERGARVQSLHLVKWGSRVSVSEGRSSLMLRKAAAPAVRMCTLHPPPEAQPTWDGLEQGAALGCCCLVWEAIGSPAGLSLCDC